MRVAGLPVLFVIAAAGLATTSLAPARAQWADHAAPSVRMLTPERVRPQRFVVLRVVDAGSGVAAGTLSVDGTRVGVGGLVKRGSVRFRARHGWVPGRLHRIRMTATDRAGNVRLFRRTIRARNFGIVKLAVRNLTRARPGARAAGGCGYVHLRPRGFPLGKAPLALGDSVMLGAAWRLTRAGFESDTLCGRSPAAGLAVLRRRRHRGTLPGTVVVALGTNSPMTSGDVTAMLRTLGPRRRLLLVTQYHRWSTSGGAQLRRAARRHPRRVRLIDWSALARRHRSWLWSDGTHLHPRGLPGYTRLIHRSVWRPFRGQYLSR